MTQDTSPDSCTATVGLSAQHRDQLLPILSFHRECLAHFTGKWPAGYRPRWKRTPWWHLMTMLFSLVGGVMASRLIITGAPVWWPLLGLSWVLTVHSGRKAQLVICHYAAHSNMTGHKWCDRTIVEILSTLLLIQHFEGYHKDHIQIHHGLRLATLEDPDMQFILALGFRPGMRREALWRHLYWTVVSPSFHWLFLKTRLQVNFIAAPQSRRMMSSIYAAAVVFGLIVTQAWLPFVVAWVIPLLPLYHIASLLQFLSEHHWLHMDKSLTRAGEEK